MRGSKGIEGPIGQAGLYGNPGDIGAVGKDGRKGKYSFFPIYHKRFKLLIQYFFRLKLGIQGYLGEPGIDGNERKLIGMFIF